MVDAEEKEKCNCCDSDYEGTYTVYACGDCGEEYDTEEEAEECCKEDDEDEKGNTK